MRSTQVLLAAVALMLPAAVFGGIDDSDLPTASVWYFHADFEEMRSTDGGKSLWNWLEKEVFAEIRQDTGVDLSKEADDITAFAAEETGVVMIMRGDISRDTQDKALAAAASAQRFETLKSGNKVFYYVQGDDGAERHNSSIEIDGMEDEFYFSFAVRNKLIVTSRREQMEELLGNGGKVAGNKSPSGALFVLTAERSLIQAGMDADEIDSDEGGGFESNVLRNTKQVALLIADVAGQIAIEAQLITKEPEMAQSLAGIVRGLIGLAAISGDMDPEMVQILQSTRVDVNDASLKVSVTLSPQVVVSALEDA
ncbi:MAG: hypothetical protein R3358_07680 [Woeseiaceae bacterium]|nr:hypothetical protein [Woeseiaceae bacterium]